MSIKRDILFRFLGDGGDLRKAASGAEKSLKGVSTSSKTANKGMDLLKGGALALGGAFAAAQIGAFAVDSFKVALSAGEAASAFDTTFGPAVEEAGEFVEEFANKAGLAEFELQQIMATSGNVVQGLGGTSTEAAELAEQMALLAGDVASFSNAEGGAAAVSEALRSAITGETDGLKTYGIVVRQADVVQQALTETGKEQAGQLTDLEKAQATMTLAYERAGVAVGDLDRTADSNANQVRQLGAMWKEVQVTVGNAVIPIFEALVPILKDIMPVVEKLATLVGKILTQAFELLAPIIDFTIGVIDKLIDGLDWVVDRVEDVAGATADAADWMLGPFINFGDEVDEASDALDGAVVAGSFVTDALARVKDTVDGLAESEKLQARATRDATNAKLEAIDPAFRLSQATDRQREAIDKLKTATGDELVAAQLAAIKATGELKAAQGAYSDAAPEAEEAIRQFGLETGLTADEIDILIGNIRDYNTLTIDPKTFKFDGVFSNLGNLFTGDGDGLIKTPGGVPLLHGAGTGVLPGRPGQDQLFIGKGGETVIDTSRGPVAVPTAGGTGQASSTPIVVQLVVDGQVLAEVVRNYEIGLN